MVVIDYKALTIFTLSFLYLIMVTAQNVQLTNGSFEDRPRMGKSGERLPIKGWWDCGGLEFPAASPPDIHHTETDFWKNSVDGAAHGRTYLTMVVREDDSYESISQKVLGTLKKGQCYNFKISLLRSEKYLSPSANDIHGGIKNFIEPAVLRVVGGNSTCDKAEVLAESEPITNDTWQEYSFTIQPNADYTFISLVAFFKTPTLFGYNGNICLDDAKHFYVIDCDTKEELIVAEADVRKKETVVYKKPKREVKKDTVIFKKKPTNKENPKLLTKLDIESIKVGEEIRIDYLYFDTDSSGIKVESYEALNEVSEFLHEHKEIKIELGGHTNGIPKHDFCDMLSTKRAKAVTDYLINKGIDSNRISYKGYGKRKPIDSNFSEEGRKRNQRVEIKILSLGE